MGFKKKVIIGISAVLLIGTLYLIIMDIIRSPSGNEVTPCCEQIGINN